jgi:hypothetical protein
MGFTRSQEIRTTRMMAAKTMRKERDPRNTTPLKESAWPNPVLIGERGRRMTELKA